MRSAVKTSASRWLALLVALVLVGCSQGVVTSDGTYITGREYTVHRVPGDEPRPIVVLLHGAGLDRHDYEAFADGLAERGSVVFNVDWDVLPASTTTTLEEIACAVRHARASGPDLGGDPNRLVLAGHSTGAVYAGAVATGGDELRGACTVESSALPNGLALLSPVQIPGGGPWRYATLGANPDLRISIVRGVDDDVARAGLSERTRTVLEDAGYEVSLEPVAGDHYDLVMVRPYDPDHDRQETTTSAAAEAMSIILGLVPDKPSPG